jgi:hypothetical protein
VAVNLRKLKGGKTGKMRHKLKTWPPFFKDVLLRKKRFELRKNDRDFRVGDEVILVEYDSEMGIET